MIRRVGERVVLRDWRPVDIEPLRYWMAPHHRWHDTNGPYFPRPSPQDIDNLIERRRQEASSPASERPTPRHSLAVTDPDSDELVGQVTWYWESEVTDWRRMGLIIFDPGRWNGGFGTDALRLWTTYLFDATLTVRLDLATYSGNPGMMAVARKLGFREEGRFRKARVLAGVYYDSVVYGVLREEWQDKLRP